MTNSLKPAQAAAILADLAAVFFQASPPPEPLSSNLEARYQALVEQIPAIVFMAYLDQGIGEAYVSPQLETTLGFSRREWLDDPIRWYHHIHPDDRERCSLDAAQMFLSGQPLRSAYRVIARDGHIVWFHCEAKMVRRQGRPWFIHGVAFDITELKRTEAALEEERNVASAILDTVAALVLVLDPQGRIVRFNRACEAISGYKRSEVQGRRLSELFLTPVEAVRFQFLLDHLASGAATNDFENHWLTREGELRLISWSTRVLPVSHNPVSSNNVRYVIASGIDITERKRLESAVLDVSNSEQRRIGQDLHDGLGQHLTGIAFLSKTLEQKLVDRSGPEAAAAGQIVALVNQAIHQTRELAHGLVPVLSDSLGLVSALEHWAGEVEKLFQITCRLECDNPVLIHDDAAANHLYRIAQEAIHNAIKHGKATEIEIGLGEMNGRGMLSIRDDGSGIILAEANQQGMGFRIMRYRAGMIGGELQITRCGDRGTLVTCMFPK